MDSSNPNVYVYPEDKRYNEDGAYTETPDGFEWVDYVRAEHEPPAAWEFEM